MSADRLEQLLADACGGRMAQAERGDAVQGVRPSYVAYPASVDEVAATVRTAHQHDLAMVPRGLGTRMSWGTAPRACDLVLDLSGLDAVRDHTASDMVVDVEAGVPLTRLRRDLAEAGQQLAVDSPSYDTHSTRDAGSLGGAIATAYAGPHRFRYGTVRDLLLGVTVVRADGEVSTSGSRVVKNVAGYDLGKLITGSFGGLGIVVSATFRLHPLPVGVRWVMAEADDMAAAHRKAWSLVDSPWELTAAVIDRPSGSRPRLAVCLEGTEAGAQARAVQAAAQAHGEVAAEEPPWFRCAPGGPENTLLTITSLPDAVPRTCHTIAELAPASPQRVDAATGIITVSLDDRADSADTIQRLRDTIDSPGHVTVRHTSSRVRSHADAWGPMPAGVMALTKRVKEQFDPSGVLAPGRVPGGV